MQYECIINIMLYHKTTAFIFDMNQITNTCKCFFYIINQLSQIVRELTMTKKYVLSC